MSIDSVLKEFFGHTLNYAKSKGDKVCSVCRTKMICGLDQTLESIDWNIQYQNKYQIEKSSICNHCFYHLILFTILMKNEETVINPKHFVLAYNLAMQYEKDGFFNPLDLSCRTIRIGESISELEKKDELQAHYCITFNNAYDILTEGTVKWYLSKNNWDKVYHYQKSKYYKLINTTRHGEVYE